ncbi:hypothetical protein CAXC1_180004 [Candidatus Xenohaliotis californiensis]|uniref:Uncharacterized protein n=1 Tax=Candidatus Xenohaliotis californiensis TaxID=84677 RepID=A0ABM9N7B8_9RICK|nr:hypothetical protein CAXC1_180004 [Candidatus Xenohaliotis californiensis]
MRSTFITQTFTMATDQNYVTNPVQLKFLCENGLLLYTPNAYRNTDYSVNCCAEEQQMGTTKQREWLFKHAISGNYTEVWKVLSRTKDLAQCTNDQNNNLAHFAAVSGNIELMKYLCSRDVDLMAKNKMGNTPLQIAITTGENQHLVHYLWQQLSSRKSDSEDDNDLSKLKDNNGCNILHLAAMSCSKNILRYVLNNIKKSDSETFIQLVNEQNNKGQTPLHLATRCNSAPLVDLLLGYNETCLDKQDDNGNTALHIASELKNHQIFEALELAGANSDIANQQGNKPKEPQPTNTLTNVTTIPFTYHDCCTLDFDFSLPSLMFNPFTIHI